MNTISTGFVAIIANKVSLSFCFRAKIISTIWLFWIFAMDIKSLFESYWPIIYIIYHLMFQPSYWKTTLWYQCNPRCSSCKWQWETIIFFVRCIYTLIQLWCYIVSINLFYFINSLFLRKSCFYDSNVFMFWLWVFLTIYLHDCSFKFSNI